MDKILVVRLSSLGDVLLSTPALRCLSKRFPFAKIHFLTKAGFAPLLEQNPYIHQVIRLEDGNLSELLHLRNRLRREYDLIVDLHRNLRTFVMVPVFGGPAIARYRKYSLRRMLLVRAGINLLDGIPSVPERYLAALKKYGVHDDGQGLDFFASQRAIIGAKDLLLRFQLQEKDPVALAPGARWLTKRWPVKRFIELMDLMPDRRFIALGEAGERDLGRELEQARPGRVVNLIGETDPLLAGEILRRCRALVSNDTGLMHLGCAVKIPVVALFGSTRQEFGFSPYRARSVVLEKSVTCRPCTAIGRDTCKRGTLECLDGIPAKEVMEALERLEGY